MNSFLSRPMVALGGHGSAFPVELATYVSFPLLTDLLGLNSGGIDVTYSRGGSNATFIDHEGIIRPLTANNMEPLIGARLANNVVVDPNDFTTGNWTKDSNLTVVSGKDDYMGGTDAFELVIALDAGFGIANIYQTYTVKIGQIVIASCRIRQVSGFTLPAIDFGLYTGISTSSAKSDEVLIQGKKITDTWQRFACKTTVVSAGTARFGFKGRSDNTNEHRYQISHMQIEFLEGAADEVPSDWVDGYTYHLDSSGNTFDHTSETYIRYVSQADGTPIAYSIFEGLLIEKAATNFADTDDANTQTIDLTTEATGDYTVSVQSADASYTITAGTATLTISDATVTEASPGHFDMTTAGTVIITLDAGTVDLDPLGNNIIQLEAGEYPTSFIPASGGDINRAIAEAYAPWLNAGGLQGDFAIYLEFEYKASRNISGEDKQLLYMTGGGAADTFELFYIQGTSDLRFSWDAGSKQTIETATFNETTDGLVKVVIRQRTSGNDKEGISIGFKKAGDSIENMKTPVTTDDAKTAMTTVLDSDLLHIGSKSGTSLHCDMSIKNVQILTDDAHLTDDYLNGLLAA